MAIRTMRLEKDEILRKKSREVDIIDDKIQTLIDDMIETMYKYNGVGLSAVQVGVLKIVKEKGTQEVEEGCLSFPNEYAKVVRPKELTVEALDRDGKKFKLKAKDLLAQAVAHEVDHLDGIVFIDRMIPGTLEYVDNNQN